MSSKLPERLECLAKVLARAAPEAHGYSSSDARSVVESLHESAQDGAGDDDGDNVGALEYLAALVLCILEQDQAAVAAHDKYAARIGGLEQACTALEVQLASIARAVRPERRVLVVPPECVNLQSVQAAQTVETLSDIVGNMEDRLNPAMQELIAVLNASSL